MRQMAYKPCEYIHITLKNLSQKFQFEIWIQSEMSDSKEFKFQKPIIPKVSDESL
jgi:hypothetical protein